MSSSTSNKRTRPVFKTVALDDQEKFQPLPLPTGKFPYQLDLLKVLPGLPTDKMVFHMAGDTGGLVAPVYKHRVANEMISQCAAAEPAKDRPQFFFHLGDVVYNFGQEAEYCPQFFEPYRHYPNPVFAIPGNHDADVDPFDQNHPNSLDAFVKVFCGTVAAPLPFSGDPGRTSNIQPNVYFTLKTPLANIIALYSNVPRFGTITSVQKEWFINELKAAEAERRNKALIVCLHHSAYSADTNHGSSLPMQLFLNAAFAEAGVWPDVVFSGHVHNYQRFSKQYTNGKMIPFIIAGAGGYADLHKIAPPGDPAFPDQSKLLDDVLLEKYCDNTHGFLKITIEKTTADFTITGDYYTVDDSGARLPATVFDSFNINLQ